MKKILAVVLALTMIVGMSISTFALTVNDTQTFDVSATVKSQDDTQNKEAVYSVNITWEFEAITFEYTSASTVYKWNPADLKYNTVDGSNSGSWAKAEYVINLENRSNAAVVVTPTWVAEGENTVQPTITGAVELASAADGQAKTGTIKVSEPATGVVTTGGKLGTLTLTITAA